ncbi:MAG: thioesterase [Verrucomicrobia bacterium]|nr:thioesterase [Verrucomicrobiota bacterium]
MTNPRPTPPAGSWWTTPRRPSHARLTLVCLPHAGAGASSYFAWGAALQPEGIEVRAVQYPGRENRLAEPLIDTAPRMVQALANVWPALGGNGACALFGHSMGALLAFELALELRRRGTANPPQRLFLSGRNPPGTPLKKPPIHHVPDAEFRREIATRYGSLPPEVLADSEMLALVTPILRADFKLVDTYRPTAAPPLETPLEVFGGTDDPWTTAAELDQWRAHTRGECRVRLFRGDHFFHQKARDEVIAAVRAELAPSLRAETGRDERLPMFPVLP